MSGTCVAEGNPTVRLAYSSAKWSRHNLETHWLGFSILIVILARGHGSDSVDKQCSNSKVSSGDITGSAFLWSIICSCLCCALAHLCVDAGRLVHFLYGGLILVDHSP